MQAPAPIVLCMGTRPEIIKMAPVYHALRQTGRATLLLHTGQHLEMARPMYEFFGIKPDYDLQLTRSSERLAHLSSLILDRLGAALAEIQPRAVLVHGDTTSALMATLASFYQQVPVGHVEAGLRSHRCYDPFPEEKNRELIGRLATWHFAPTSGAVRNLLNEGLDERCIHRVGNSIVDAVHLGVRRLEADRALPAELGPGGELRAVHGVIQRAPRLMIVTAHRRENWGEPLRGIAGAVRHLLEQDAQLSVVWPVHLNPTVAGTVRAAFDGLEPRHATRLFLVNPISYPAMLFLLQRAWMVLTDSGGVQEEAACLHVPILVLRESTERPELIDAGAGALVGTRHDAIVAAVRRLHAHEPEYRRMRAAANPFGDGLTAERICETLLQSTPHNEKDHPASPHRNSAGGPAVADRFDRLRTGPA